MCKVGKRQKRTDERYTGHLQQFFYGYTCFPDVGLSKVERGLLMLCRLKLYLPDCVAVFFRLLSESRNNAVPFGNLIAQSVRTFFCGVCLLLAALYFAAAIYKRVPASALHSRKGALFVSLGAALLIYDKKLKARPHCVFVVAAVVFFKMHKRKISVLQRKRRVVKRGKMLVNTIFLTERN